MIQGTEAEMRAERSWCFGTLAIFLILSLTGCTPGGRSGIDIPSVDAESAAEKALNLYDKDANGWLDKTELTACPGILGAIERYDTDRNNRISGEEIAARLAALFSSGVGLTPVSCNVVLGGQPLSGAKLRFSPDPFLEGALKPATGTTDDQGRVNIAIPDDQLPSDQHGLRAMQPGVYRVEIEHPSVKHPALPLGCEIDPTSRGGTQLVFRL